ncbi:MAG: hypothetical protein OXG71_09720, partial [Rhodospirillales bacterium]|nr:hypothetical protein [Rhodospirillales bacterium]
MSVPVSDATRLAELIAGDVYGKKLDLSARGIETDGFWQDLPTLTQVHRFRARGVSEREVRRFLTFICAVDYMRPAAALWRDGGVLFDKHPEVFDPSHASTMAFDELRELLRAHRVSKKHRPDSNAWRRIARNLAVGQGAVARVVHDGNGDAEDVLRDLRRKTGGQARYPLLRGPKIGPMWLRIMVDPGGARISRMELVPVAVDVQVRRVTENLGMTDTKGLSLRRAKPLIQCAWRDAVQDADFGGARSIENTCAALDPALWFFGVHGCSHCDK